MFAPPPRPAEDIAWGCSWPNCVSSGAKHTRVGKIFGCADEPWLPHHRSHVVRMLPVSLFERVSFPSAFAFGFPFRQPEKGNPSIDPEHVDLRPWLMLGLNWYAQSPGCSPCGRSLPTIPENHLRACRLRRRNDWSACGGSMALTPSGMDSRVHGNKISSLGFEWPCWATNFDKTCGNGHGWG